MTQPASVSTPDAEVVGSPDSLRELVAIMDRLRSPGGCPWDAEQTHASLVTYLLEETYETIDAIESSDQLALREELGDLLLQVVFHARVAEEDATSPFTIDDVAVGITDKLIRRHPHVFADVDVDGARDVEANWAALKKTEKARASAIDGIPMTMPSLALSAKVLDRSERAGVDVESLLPLGNSLGPVDAPYGDVEAWGDLFLVLVGKARQGGVDAEMALRSSVHRFADRVRAAE